MRHFSLLVLFMSILAISTQAQAQRLHATYKDWRVYSINQDGKKVCYIATSAVKEEGNYKRRSEPYLLVTSINNKVDEVSTSSGYPYKKGSEVKLKIDNKNAYDFFTRGEIAWAQDTEQDTEIVKKMIKGLKLSAKGTSQKGTYSIDTYSLRGFSSAHKKMKSLCG